MRPLKTREDLTTKDKIIIFFLGVVVVWTGVTCIIGSKIALKWIF